MSFLNKIRDDVESDLLTSTYPTLRNKFKKVIYEDPDEDIAIYQNYFGLNKYNLDLSEIYLINKIKEKKQLNYYIFLDSVKQIKCYNNTIILIDEKDNKRIFKRNYYLKYYYLWNTLKNVFTCKYNLLDYYYLEIN